MTKQGFEEGKPFTMINFRSHNNTYRYERGAVMEQFRNSTGQLLFERNLLNAQKIGGVMVQCSTFVMDTKVSKRLRYEDMLEYSEDNFVFTRGLE
jgi:hypothetical protein